MSYALIQKFQKLLHGTKGMTIHGPMSPLILTVPWLNTDIHNIDLLTIHRGRESFMVISEKEYRGECIRGFQEYSNSKVHLNELSEEYIDLEKRVNTFYDRAILIDYKKLSDAELEGLTQEMYALFIDLANRTIYIEIFDQDMVREVLGTKGQGVIDAVWEHGTHPTFVSFEGRRLRALLNFVSQKDHSSLRPIQYIYTDYIGKKSDKEIHDSIGVIKEHAGEKEIECKKIEMEADFRLKEYHEWKGTLSELSLKTVEYMQLMMKLRDHRKDIIAKMQVIILDIAVELFLRAGIDPHYVPHAGLIEITKGISSLRNNKETIERYKNGSISITYHTGKYESELCDYDEAVKEYYELNTEIKDQLEIKGQIANKGFKKGIVRIVIDPHDDKGFQSGDILVTSMTRPEFVPIMKKAGAVITNEGGITCHAAIISRELNIPCVIGTKNATQILKDGDMVEVDADKGIVRIIK